PSQRGPAVVQEYTQGIAATQGDDDLEQTDEAWLEAPDESMELSSLSRHLPSEVGLPPPIRRSQRIAQRDAPANKRQRGVSSNVSVLAAVQLVAQQESQLEPDTQPPPLRGYKRSARGTVYKAERICGEEVRGAKLWYHVAWEGYEERTWEPVQNIIDKGLIDEWKAICSQRKGEAWDLSEDVLMEEPI
ncbi:chromo (CHRromatin Organisation MOdifier) domain, partial [Haematococcus lacustris]